MLLKLLIFVLLMAAITSLAFAIYALIKDQGRSMRTARALKWRLIFTISLLLLLILGAISGELPLHSFGH